MPRSAGHPCIKKISKEGKEAYGYEALYKVQAVTVIPRPKKLSSEDEKRRSKREQSSTLEKKFFADVLDEACEREQQKDIHIYTNGYTKNALPYYNCINMREYC